MTYARQFRTILSDSLCRQLNMYALAAGATGVGALALTQTAEAKIVYTPADISIGPREMVKLDVNHDGVPDFVISNYFAYASCFNMDQLGAFGARTEADIVAVRKSQKTLAADLARGLEIGPKLGFGFFTASGTMAKFRYQCATGSTYSSFGLWRNVKNKYLGLKFSVGGKIHYGWARLTVSAGGQFFATLTGYAYETIPGKAIIAGQTKGTDDIEQPNAGLTMPTAEPAMLGALALGAPGLSIWRREEEKCASVNE